MKAHDIQLRRVRSVHETEFDDLVKIYTEAHPRSERKSPERLSTMIQQTGYFFLVAVESSVVVGFSIVRAFDNSDAALLEYMAVAHDRRNQGVGQRLFVETANFEEISSRFLLAEVDSEKKPTDDRADRIRRKNFYRRLGCREVEQLCYIMPPVSSSAPPDMDILVYKRDLPPFIELTRLRQWLVCCYVQVYGLSASDPRIANMLQGLPANVRLV
jgi:ribosomal protein S18 acetylase RimI-like enzyme